MIKFFFSSYKKKEQTNKGVHSMLLALEPRIVFDGALAATGAEVAGDGFVNSDVLVETSLTSNAAAENIFIENPNSAVVDNIQPVAGEAVLPGLYTNSDTEKIKDETDSFINKAASQGNQSNKDVSIAFVDTCINGYEQIVKGLDENIHVYLINKDDPGTETLLGNIKDFTKDNGVADSIMIFSHGGKGWFGLGNDIVSSDSLKSEHGEIFDSLSSYLSSDADLLIYGCNTGEGDVGESFIKELSVLTKADVAASDDITGSKEHGGDWILEKQQGKIEKGFINLEDFSGILAAPSLTDSGPERRMTDEDTTLTFNKLNVSGGESATITISLTENNGLPSNGSFSLNSSVIDKLSFTAGDGEDDTTMTFEGSISDINTALNGMTYSPSDNYNGDAKLAFTIKNEADEASNSAIEIEVIQKNDAPVLNAPELSDSNVATIDEGAGNKITLTPLNFGVDATGNSTLGLFDPDLDNSISTVKQQSADQLVFELLSEPDPLQGRLIIDGSPLLKGSLFSLQDLIDNKVEYEHQGKQAHTGSSVQDSFNVIIRDGAKGQDTGTINIKINPVNQAPSIDGSISVTPYEGRKGIDVSINVTDPDQTSSAWKIDFSNLNLDGGVLYLEKGGNSAYNQGSDIKITDGYTYKGSLADLNSQLSIDVSDGEPTSAITFDVTATDDDGGEKDGGTTPGDGLAGKSTITINQVENNDHPVLDTNQGNDSSKPYLAPEKSATLNIKDLLNVKDLDSPDTNITYTLTTNVLNTNSSGGTAEIRLGDKALQSGSTFTQDDINKGLVKIIFTGSDGSGIHDFNFGFSVRDGELTAFSASKQTLYGKRIEGGTRNDNDDGYLSHQLNFRITNPQGSGTSSTPIPVNEAPVIKVEGITSDKLVEEGAYNTIVLGTNGFSGPRIEITDPDNTPDEIRVRIEKLPEGGKIQVNGKDLKLFETFTQKQLQDGEVKYVHNGGEHFLSSSLGFAFSVSDGSANVTPHVDSDGNNFKVEAKPVNDTPVATVDKTGVVTEGGTIIFNTTGKPSITLDDVDGTGDLGPGSLDNHKSETGVDELYVTLSDDVDYGDLYLDKDNDGVIDTGEEFNKGDTLKKSEIESNLFKYKHDGTENFKDSFEITINDAQGFDGSDSTNNNSVGSPVTINIQIAPVNDDPIVAASTTDKAPLNTSNKGLRVPEGAAGIIAGIDATKGGTSFGGSEKSQLLSYDPDNSETQIQYRITTNVSKGVLLLDGWVLGEDSTFTQDDLDGGKVKYRHNGVDGSGAGNVTDYFEFQVGDSGGGSYPTGRFDIEVLSKTNDSPMVTTPSGSINIDDYDSSLNKIAGVSVGDRDNHLFHDFLQVTIRLTDSSGNPFTNAGEYSAYKITSSTTPLESENFKIDGTNDGDGTYLELRGDIANINRYLEGLELGCTTDPDLNLKLEIIADDRIRVLDTGILDTSKEDANGGETNQDDVPRPVDGTEFDAYTDKVLTHAAGKYNIVSDTVDLRVSTKDSLPVITVPGSQTVLEDVEYTINGITVQDAESSGIGVDITAILSVGSGKLNVDSHSGVRILGNDSETITLTGHADDINTLLGKGVKYTSAANNHIDTNDASTGDVTLTFSVKEGTAAIGQESGGKDVKVGDDTLSLDIPINITPTNDAPTVDNSQDAIAISKADVLVDVVGFKLGDIDIAGDPGDFTIGEELDYVEVTVRLLDDHDTPLREGAYHVAPGDKAVLSSSFSGGVSIDSDLNGDGKALQIRGSIQEVQGYLDGLQLSLGPSLSETDSFYKVEVIVDDRSRDADGKLDSSGIDANGGEQNVDESGASVNVLKTEIDPYSNDVSIPLNTDSATINVFLSSENDPADITANDVVVDENTGIVKLTADNANIIVDDPDDNGGQIEATITVSKGLITAVGGSGGTITGLDSNQISITGITESELNERLKDLSITLPDPDGGGSATSADWNGKFQVEIVVNDKGYTGERPTSLSGDTNDAKADPGDYSHGVGSELVTTRIIDVVVNPRNDAPVITGTSADPEFVVQDDNTQTTGGPLKLLQNGVKVEDVDILSDLDVNSFGGGKITISFDGYGDGDKLSIAGGILDGMDGAATGGSGKDLIINLKNDATASQVASILEAVEFNNTNSNPLNNDSVGNNYERNFSIVLNDGNNNNDAGAVDGVNDSGGLTAGPPHSLDSNILSGTILFRTPPDATDNSNTIVKTASTLTGDVRGDNDGNGVDSDNEDPITSLVVSKVQGKDLNVGVSVSGTYGSIVINSDGTYTYTLNTSHADVVALSPSDSDLKETFIYTIKDTDNTTDSASLTINISGAGINLVATDNANSVTEGDSAPATGNVITDNDGNGVDNDSDGDNSKIKVIKVNGIGGNIGSIVTGNYGEVTINADGTYSYTLDNTNLDVIKLYAGEKLMENFTYEITDEGGDTASANLKITINGDKDLLKPPVATNNFGTVNIDKVKVNGNVITDDNGNGVDDDPDGPNADLVVTKVDGDLSSVGKIINGKYGSVTINSDGFYTYNLNTSKAEFISLADGKTLKETFSYQITDVDGFTDSAELVIFINGNNNHPHATDNLNSVVEDVKVSTSGSLISDDDGFGVDKDPENDPLSVSVDNTTGVYGKLSVNPDGTYTYSLNNDHVDVKALGADDEIYDVFIYTIDDGNGGTDSAKLTITIKGVNSTPEATDNTNTVKEDEKLTATGNLLTDDDGSGIDRDPENDPLSVSVDNTTGAYGKLSVNPDGTYTYTLNNDHADVQKLGEKDSITDSFVYTISDGNGGTDTANLTITITGVEELLAIELEADEEQVDNHLSVDNSFNDDSSSKNNFHETMHQTHLAVPDIFLALEAEDKVVQAGIEQVFTISESLFHHTDHQESFSYEASGANGEDLPDWLSFDPATLTFHGTPPTGEGPTEVIVVITASDSSLNTAQVTFTIKVQREIGESGSKNFVENKNPGSDYIKLIGLESEFKAEPGKSDSFDSSKLFVRENGSPVKIQNFSASSADGAPLPNWVQIDPETGKVTVTPPNGAEDIEIIVEGKDSYGNETTGRIKIDTAGDNNSNEIADDLKGHPGLNAQFKSIGVKGLHKEAGALLNSLNEIAIG